MLQSYDLSARRQKPVRQTWRPMAAAEAQCCLHRRSWKIWTLGADFVLCPGQTAMRRWAGRSAPRFPFTLATLDNGSASQWAFQVLPPTAAQIYLAGCLSCTASAALHLNTGAIPAAANDATTAAPPLPSSTRSLVAECSDFFLKCTPKLLTSQVHRGL